MKCSLVANRTSICCCLIAILIHLLHGNDHDADLVEHAINIVDIHEHDLSVEPQDHEIYLEREKDVDNQRVLCEEAQMKTNEQMIRSYSLRNKASSYDVGEIVLVRNSQATSTRSSRHGKRVLHKIPSFESFVKKKNGHRYQIQYATETGEQPLHWFPVSVRIAQTKDAENVKLVANVVQPTDESELGGGVLHK